MIQDWGPAHWKYFWLSLIPRKDLQPDPTGNGIQYSHRQVTEGRGPGRNGGNFSEKISTHPLDKVDPEDQPSSPNFINNQRSESDHYSFLKVKFPKDSVKVWVQIFPHRIRHWTLGRAVWAGLESAVFLKETCHGGGGFNRLKPHTTSTFLCFMLTFEGLSSQLAAPVTVPASYCHAPPPWWDLTVRERWDKINISLYKMPWSRRFVPATGRK